MSNLKIFVLVTCKVLHKGGLERRRSMKQRAGVFVEREIFATKRLHATAVRSTIVFSKENLLAMLKF